MDKKTQSEIRQDYIHDRAVIIAPGRENRPHHFEQEGEGKSIPQSKCPFCPEKLKNVKAVLTVGSENKWSVKVIKNVFPVFSLENPHAYGLQEVIVETPDHQKEMSELTLDHFIKILGVYQKRTAAISKNNKFQYLLIFKNNGGRAGASLTHAHSQILATSFLPPHILHRLTRAEEYKIQMGSCYYCDLIRKEKKSPRFVWEDEHMSCFTPWASNYNYEAWIFPKRHVDNISVLNKHEIRSLATILKNILEKLRKFNLPYNFYLHQAIRYPHEHFYLRISPRRNVWAGIELGSRLIVNSVAPEIAAQFYREK
ncbi:MAG: DUF4931 domain-containing protein [Patescibacteria group bacterium]